MGLAFSVALIHFSTKYNNVEITYDSQSSLDLQCLAQIKNPFDIVYIILLLARAELVSAVLLLLSAVGFIGIYIDVYLRALHDDRNKPHSSLNNVRYQPVESSAPLYETIDPEPAYQSPHVMIDLKSRKYQSPNAIIEPGSVHQPPHAVIDPEPMSQLPPVDPQYSVQSVNNSRY